MTATEARPKGDGPSGAQVWTILYRSGGADESDTLSAATDVLNARLGAAFDLVDQRDLPTEVASRSELVTATALLSRAASVVPAIRQSRPGCRQRRERTMNRGLGAVKPARGTYVGLSVRSSGGTQIVSGSSGDGSRSYLSSTLT